MKRYTYKRLREMVNVVNEVMEVNGENRKFQVYCAYGVNSVREVCLPGYGLKAYGDQTMKSPRESAMLFARQLLADGYYEASEIAFSSLMA